MMRNSDGICSKLWRRLDDVTLCLQFDLDKLEKGSVEWNNAMIRMLLKLKDDGHKIKEYVSGSGNKVSAAAE